MQLLDVHVPHVGGNHRGIHGLRGGYRGERGGVGNWPGWAGGKGGGGETTVGFDTEGGYRVRLAGRPINGIYDGWGRFS